MLKKFWSEKSWIQKLALLFLFIGILGFSYARAMKESEAGDFHVFWFAGKMLLSGQDIYYIPPGLRNFIYPPFAALFFAPLTVFPFKIATFIFFVTNFALATISFIIIKKILDLFYTDKKVVKAALIGSLIISFKLCWNNIMMIQSNQVVFLFTALGIYYFLKEKENWAIAFFCLAISLKIFPILFAFWVVIRGSKFAVLKFALGGALCIALPMIFSGVPFGLAQLDWYLHNFLLKVISADALNLSYANQSLSGTLGRVFTTMHDPNEPVYTIVNLGLERTKLLILISKLIIVLSMFAVLIISKIKFKKSTLIEPAIIILAIHLISGVTWKAHLVSLSLVFAYISAELWGRRKHLKAYDIFCYSYLIAIALLGQAFVGRKGQLIMNGWGDYTFVMIFSFVFLLISFYRQVSKEQLQPN